MVEFAFYKDTYKGGSIQEADWPVFAARAEDQLNRFKRIYAVTAPDENAESMAICALAEALDYFTAVQNGGGGPVSSASIGSVSASYAGAAAVDVSPKGQEKELLRCARMYLNIYRGVG